MKKAALQLNFHILLSERYRAEPIRDVDIDEDDEEISPAFEAHIVTENEFTVTARVRLGEEGKTPYFIECEMLGSFTIAAPLDQFAPPKNRRSLYSGFAVNGAQVLYGALRSHVALLTHMGPHRSRVLPLAVIQPGDVKIGASAQVAALLAELEKQENASEAEGQPPVAAEKPPKEIRKTARKRG